MPKLLDVVHALSMLDRELEDLATEGELMHSDVQIVKGCIQRFRLEPSPELEIYPTLNTLGLVMQDVARINGNRKAIQQMARTIMLLADALQSGGFKITEPDDHFRPAGVKDLEDAYGGRPVTTIERAEVYSASVVEDPPDPRTKISPAIRDGRPMPHREDGGT